MGRSIDPILDSYCLPYFQLIQWLQYAEDHEEKVHIIGHHPPRRCLAVFAWNFHQIVNR